MQAETLKAEIPAGLACGGLENESLTTGNIDHITRGQRDFIGRTTGKYKSGRGGGGIMKVKVSAVCQSDISPICCATNVATGALGRRKESRRIDSPTR